MPRWRNLADLPANACAGVVKLVDTHGLGPCAERLRGSSPLTGIFTYFMGSPRHSTGRPVV